MTTIQQALDSASKKLAMHDTARLDAELLLAHALDVSRTYLHTWPEKPLEEQLESRFHELVDRRAHGEPVAYLIGYHEFWSLKLQVTPQTLIPRPETELLVEQALARIPVEAQRQILDLGTGSGAIALALASERPECNVFAVERDPGALKVAQDNASQLGIQNTTFVEGNWFAPLADARFDLIVCNPPYIADDDPHLRRGDVRFEPMTALQAGADGLSDLRQIIAEAPQRLEPLGWLCVEHGFDQAARVADLFVSSDYLSVSQYRDLAGHHRVTCGRNPTGGK